MWLLCLFAFLLLITEIIDRAQNLFSYVQHILGKSEYMPDQVKVVTFQTRDGRTVSFNKTGARAEKRKLEKEAATPNKKVKTESTT